MIKGFYYLTETDNSTISHILESKSICGELLIENGYISFFADNIQIKGYVNSVTEGEDIIVSIEDNEYIFSAEDVQRIVEEKQKM